MGRISEHVATMRGCSLREIVDAIAEMEDGPKDLLGGVPVADFAAEFDEVFWPSYPHKTGKPVAKKAYEKARKRGNQHLTIMSGLRRYMETKPADRPWLNPATFLNQDRFADQPAAVHKPSNTSELRNDLRHRVFSQGSPDTGSVRRLAEREAISGQSPRLLGRGQ